ncbi:MAG: 2-amino-4-hydroxy-6-hydroxymethyldihydropteridine diphosphokinase [Hyphomicrobiaceae bacterium]|nr:2-amino-4-hydroxy-6-hydroxymethyldihydropteridine diphosphokinase [Hyphomicrobiaceae bacterium]
MSLARNFDAIVALGANIGDKRANIARALELLCAQGDISILARSRDFKTPPWGITDQPWFVNACASVRTELGARALLERCLDVERKLGRVRAQKWGPRIIDLDVLVHLDGAVNEPDLVLPHPRITERAFVLAPLADVAPDLELNGKTVAEWLAVTDQSGVEPFVD